MTVRLAFTVVLMLTLATAAARADDAPVEQPAASVERPPEPVEQPATPVEQPEPSVAEPAPAGVPETDSASSAEEELPPAPEEEPPPAPVADESPAPAALAPSAAPDPLSASPPAASADDTIATTPPLAEAAAGVAPEAPEADETTTATPALEPAPAAGVSTAAPAPAPAEEPGFFAPFKGTTVIYEHAATAVSVRKDALPMYNPYWAHRVSLRPEWHPEGLPVFLRARFDLWQELTVPDDAVTVDATDLLLDVVWTGWKEPATGLRLGGNVRFGVPLSKWSHAQSLRGSVSPALTFSRPFQLGDQSLFVSYAVRYGQAFHRYTTTQFDGPTIAHCGDPNSPACSEQLHTGTRNTQWTFSQGPLLVYTPIPVLSLTVMATSFVAGLYPLTAGEVATATGPVSIDATSRTGTQHRFLELFVFDATWTASNELSFSLGGYTFQPQLGPDGKRWPNPFFNRNVVVYLDAVINVEALLSRDTGGQASGGRFLQ